MRIGYLLTLSRGVSITELGPSTHGTWGHWRRKFEGFKNTMLTKIYHLAVLKFGGVKSAILIGSLLFILLLCAIAALCCFLHLTFLQKRNPPQRVHRAPIPPNRKRTLETLAEQSTLDMPPPLVRRNELARREQEINMSSAPAAVRPISTYNHEESLIARDSYKRVQGVVSEEPKKATNPLKADLEKQKPELKLLPVTEKQLSAPEKIEFIRGHVNASMSLLAETSRRINSLELIMGDRMYLANSTVNRALIQARRIIRAIHTRVRTLDALIATPSHESVQAAYTIACSDLEVPKDTVHALLDADTLEPINPNLWMKSIDSLLCEAENCVKTAINQ